MSPFRTPQHIYDPSLAVPTRCVGLVSLSLAACRRISDAGVEAVARMCPSLATLNLARCNMVTDQGMLALAENAHSLKALVMFGVHHAMACTYARRILLKRGVAISYRLPDGVVPRPRRRRGSSRSSGVGASGGSGRDAGARGGGTVGNGDGSRDSTASARRGSVLSLDAWGDEDRSHDSEVIVVCSAQYSDSRECECPMVECAHCASLTPSCMCEDHAEACRYTPTSCSCCGEGVPRSRIAEHFERECHAYTVACPRCSQFMPRHAVDQHLSTCMLRRVRAAPAYTPIGCPLRTDGCLSRGDLAHIASCSHYFVLCPCGSEVLRSTLEQHREGCDASRRPVELRGLSEALRARDSMSDDERLRRFSLGRGPPRSFRSDK